MKKSFCAIFFCILSISPALVIAQLNHFVYLQTESKQPFYAKLDKKILSSSSSGYLIIPRLKDGTYSIIIGFPKNENSEQTFICTINNNDAGYLVKNLGDKGWGLLNLQTLDMVMADSPARSHDVAKTEKTDEFSNMLSDVVNDPSIKQAERPKEVTKPVIVKKEEVNKEPKIIEAPKSENKPQSVAELPLKAVIQKKQLITGEKETIITYIDIHGNSHDTVTIFIPAETADSKVIDEHKVNGTQKRMKSSNRLLKEGNLGVTEKQKPDEAVIETLNPLEQDIKAVNNEQTVIKKEQAKVDSKFLPIEVSASDKPNTVNGQPAVTPMINSDCKSYATDEDFLKLRKKMAGVENDDEMMSAAQKAFKAKCYTTEQVKNLSVLFLKDAGKYRFFDLAYQYVSDSHNFGTLEDQLTEAYYISRFKAMIRH
ncbi:MAG: DUF4476 domain-containing protein [Chitinophagaceae bacterium]|nr:DUF4476 domain-containing protein [Chitinophagaceae bacterium]